MEGPWRKEEREIVFAALTTGLDDHAKQCDRLLSFMYILVILLVVA